MNEWYDQAAKKLKSERQAVKAFLEEQLAELVGSGDVYIAL